MNLSKQIKKYRNQLQLSQEELAEKLYVSRQTVSNWENEKSYPDIHNLLLLSTLFNVSLDELVKGDVKKMKEKVSKSKMNQHTKFMIIFLVLTAVSVGPSLFLPKYWWVLPPLIFWIITMYHAFKIEKIKRKENIQTYEEILAFVENKNLDEVRFLRNKKKDRLKKIQLVTLIAVFTGLLVLLSALPYILLK